MEGEKENPRGGTGFEGVREALSRYLDGYHVSYEQACSQAVLFVIVSLIERRGRVGAHEATRILECLRHQVPVLKETLLRKKAA